VVRDASHRGLGILLARRFEPGTELVVEGVPGPGGESQRWSARVVRVRAARAGHWVHGCEFTQLLSDERLQFLLKAI